MRRDAMGRPMLPRPMKPTCLSMGLCQPEEGEGPHLDALAWRRVGRRGGVDERGMGGEPCPAVPRRVVDLEYQRLVAPHFGEIEPPMLRVVAHLIGLAHPMGIAPFGSDQVARCEAPR